MVIGELLSNKLEYVWIRPFDPRPVHKNDPEPDTGSYDCYLQFSNDQLYLVKPCEQQVYYDRYPSLVLDIVGVSFDQLNEVKMRSTIFNAIAQYLPSTVISIQLADPLGEDTLTGITLYIERDMSLHIQHILPPMTLGISARPV